MARKIVKIIAVIFVAAVLIHLVLHSISYHEENNYSEIQSIQYSRFVENSMDKKFVSADDVKQIENKIRHINFYYSKESALQESPTSILTINYKDGKKKEINIAGNCVLIGMFNSNGEFQTDKSEIYYVSLFDIWLLEKFIFG